MFGSMTEPLALSISLDGLDENVRKCIVELLNIIDRQATELQRLRDESARLREEVAKLKGQRPSKPQADPPQDRAAGGPNKGDKDRSSEKERHEPKPRQNHRQPLQADTRQRLCMEPSQLPPDAQFKGCETTIVQDLVLRRNNIAFEREKYYSAQQGKTFLAPLPPEYQGYEYGPGVRSLVLVLYYACGVTEPKLQTLLVSLGIQISTGQVSNLVTQKLDVFHEEKAEVFDAGLASSPWQHMDDTGTSMAGASWHCHAVCNPLYTVFTTRPSKDRATVIEVLRNGRPSFFRVTAWVLEQLEQQGVGLKWRQALAAIPPELEMTEEHLRAVLAPYGEPGPSVWAAIADVCRVQGYRASTDGPVAKLLLTDSASTFQTVTEEHGMCWVHDGRLYKQLTPTVAVFVQEVERFLDLYWALYRQLLAYKGAPTARRAEELRVKFDEVFSTPTMYDGLRDRIARTRAKKEELLLVLKHPEIPLHNNEAELAERDRARKRDVSLAAQSERGLRAWDTLQSVLATAKKLGVGVVQYVEDRVKGLGQIPRLAKLIEAKAAQLRLGLSWELPLLAA